MPKNWRVDNYCTTFLKGEGINQESICLLIMPLLLFITFTMAEELESKIPLTVGIRVCVGDRFLLPSLSVQAFVYKNVEFKAVTLRNILESLRQHLFVPSWWSIIIYCKYDISHHHFVESVNHWLKNFRSTNVTVADGDRVVGNIQDTVFLTVMLLSSDESIQNLSQANTCLTSLPSRSLTLNSKPNRDLGPQGELCEASSFGVFKVSYVMWALWVIGLWLKEKLRPWAVQPWSWWTSHALWPTPATVVLC